MKYRSDIRDIRIDYLKGHESTFLRMSQKEYRLFQDSIVYAI